MKKRILFLCTGNSCRSQMAEGWLKTLGGDRFAAYSAGIEAHGKNPRAIAVMREAGVDISGQESEVLDPKLLDSLDLLVTVCGHADDHCPTVPVSCEKAHWPFDDPAKAKGTEEEIMAEFRRVRDQIKAKITAFLASA
ncbi:MAG: arsenate reductase (thioredoxin) [Zetaproteobacteria bacterium CG12_big_fil_rev_8_21_14_0_65_55_1124]|nr:MAG: arsenate reductase (thioredoxin) [Zetaproteobacteria bacterium CG1_02_55_237]PIS20269.1 MAG: arsenate reductase (thioredoxin) [Zetaproteobacteria bacterium CG08_land_8_20_14_0_20_55_17]PIW43146.1 MAG: arsenate reductase (thioredoxin) [Zetaproteobacteria bacterium CG12_big_fil_rev_8_21_14_0_65_55_1124]PIY52110.1 MAG: arsenate reductase (thioredoxin) [Zetaproteobacteria bacterium CG_4_10_14_0_8_um_filter_55_43]PIZ38122.1 MAG: arsenate reductase (thioredoxin) [Zetaproteobacteria bacterium 